jgi:hypothetical protein
MYRSKVKLGSLGSQESICRREGLLWKKPEKDPIDLRLTILRRGGAVGKRGGMHTETVKPDPSATFSESLGERIGDLPLLG